MRINRRQFIAAASVGAAAAFSAEALPLGAPLGCQVYPVRKQISSDLDGTLRELAGFGYKLVEFCSPPGYGSDFAPLVNLKASELRRRIENAGLRCVSSHYQFRELQQHLEERIAFAKELGLEHMVVASLGVPNTATLDDWRRAADGMNKLGEGVRKAGLTFAFHNHDSEFRQLDGITIFDELMKRFDPKLVKSQFQVSVAAIGVDPVAYISKYPKRIASLHLQDWSAEKKQLVAVGTGSIDWKKLFRAAQAGGANYYFVEMDREALRASAPFLKQFQG